MFLIQFKDSEIPLRLCRIEWILDWKFVWNFRRYTKINLFQGKYYFYINITD